MVAAISFSMVIFWLIAFVFFLVVEGITVGLVSLWFAGGALVAMIAAALHAPLWLQILIFIIVTAALLLLLRPLSKSAILTKKTPTNADRNIGREAIVTEDIDNLLAKGCVKLDSVIWTARSTDGYPIPAGQVVIVDRIEGVKLYVSLPEIVE